MSRKTYITVWFCKECDKIFRTSQVDRYNPFCDSCDGKLKPKCMEKNKVEQKRDKCFVDILMQDNPRWSTAMGCGTHQIPEMMKHYPDATYNPETGDLLVKNRAHKKKQMRERGLDEH